LRAMLTEVAWVFYRLNPWAKSFVDRIKPGDEVGKLLRIEHWQETAGAGCGAMLRDNTPMVCTAPGGNRVEEGRPGEDAATDSRAVVGAPPRDNAA